MDGNKLGCTGGKFTGSGTVKKSVMEKYSDYVIDDADYVVTPDNEWYILDLENKQTGKEFKAKVDKDGTWL